MSKERIKNCKCCGKFLTAKQISKGNVFCCHSCATSYRSKAIDPDFFKIDKKDVFYILGLLFTDGNIDKRKSRITLSLSDKEIIEKLYPLFSDTQKRKVYEYTPHNTPNANTMYTIVNTNTNSISKLLAYGMTPAQTSSKQLPEIPQKYVWHFIRGVFDGNGCIYISGRYKGIAYKAISITNGSYDFSMALLNLLKSLGLNPTINFDSRRGESTQYIHIYKKEEIAFFMEKIYTDANLYIEYKHNRFVNDMV